MRTLIVYLSLVLGHLFDEKLDFCWGKCTSLTDIYPIELISEVDEGLQGDEEVRKA